MNLYQVKKRWIQKAKKKLEMSKIQTK